MTRVADLELELSPGSDEGYQLELRYHGPEDASDVRVRGARLERFDPARLRALAADVTGQGAELGASVLGQAEVQRLFRQARAIADHEEGQLRLRLILDVPELHRLKWETMHDPDTNAPLFTGERVLFSRYIASSDFRGGQQRRRGELQALVVVASPTDLNTYRVNGRELAPIDVAGEAERARRALRGIGTEVLARDKAVEPVGPPTLDAILRWLRAGRDILYIVCHGGTRRDGEPQLWLENADGTTGIVTRAQLVEALGENLRIPPTLVILASCQSAGAGDAARSDDGGVLAAIGPRLAAAGVHAVIAMQGDVSQQTITTFMPAFFRELASDGQIDRAMAVARYAVHDRPDWWVPTLFMRLRSGGLWFATGFGDDEEARAQLPSFLAAIRNRRCTPILGPGLIEPIAGSNRDIARLLAEQSHFPLANQDREDLPQVAQYVSIDQDRGVLVRRYFQHVCDRIGARYREDLSDALQQPIDPNASLARLAERCRALYHAAWQSRRDVDAEPYGVLAGLPFATYLNTNPDDLLVEALRASEPKREPRVGIPEWNPSISVPMEYQVPLKHRPTEEQPLVYQLFGYVGVPDSVVLTQDNYFDVLMAMTAKRILPSSLKTALSNSALLFLGFRIDDWQFRVLLRFIKNLEGSELLSDHSHVAVQIDPEQQRFHDPRAAGRYLAKYFRKMANIYVYWGSAEDFLRELHAEYNKAVDSGVVAAGGAQ